MDLSSNDKANDEMEAPATKEATTKSKPQKQKLKLYQIQVGDDVMQWECNGFPFPVM